MKHVHEIYHKYCGFLRNLTDTPIQFGGSVGGYILEPWPEPVDGLPSPLWQLAPEIPVGAFYGEPTGIYSQDLDVRPGNWGGKWKGDQPHIYAPVRWIVPEGFDIPEDRRDVIYAWQI